MYRTVPMTKDYLTSNCQCSWGWPCERHQRTRVKKSLITQNRHCDSGMALLTDTHLWGGQYALTLGKEWIRGRLIRAWSTWGQYKEHGISKMRRFWVSDVEGRWSQGNQDFSELPHCHQTRVSRINKKWISISSLLKMILFGNGIDRHVLMLDISQSTSPLYPRDSQ